MSLYPSLEDLKVDQLSRAQREALNPHPQQNAYPSVQPGAPYVPPTSAHSSNLSQSLYPSLQDYMGLDLSPAALKERFGNEVAILPPREVAISVPGNREMVAPISGGSLGLKRAQVTHGIREITVCKDAKGKVGVRMQEVNKGIFAVLVQANTPAAMAGLRFGDQILQIDDKVVAGYTMNQVHDIIKKASPQKISMVVRDRPFERTVTLHKDSVDHIGFVFRNGKIVSLVKDSSAARNGLLTDHQLLEVNGQNVVGIKDSDITKIVTEGGNVITVTIMPSFIYDHMMKYMAKSIVKKLMDHSIPDI